jgi:hypothetical protein
MADMASRSFRSAKQWHHTSDSSFVAAFNHLFPLPQQHLWTVFRLTQNISTRVTPILQMKHSKLDRQIPKIGQHIGKTGVPTSNLLWGWIQVSNAPDTPNESLSSQRWQHKTGQDSMAENECSHRHWPDNCTGTCNKPNKILGSNKCSRVGQRQAPHTKTAACGGGHPRIYCFPWATAHSNQTRQSNRGPLPHCILIPSLH